ncbi:MAG: hypothetical protein WBV94_16545 [Blastocatellia bacterium]
MKNYLVRGLLILCLFAGIGGAQASAQIDSDETIVADIPYDFVVRDQTLPAGKYTIKVSDDKDLSVLVLRSANGRRSALFQTQDIQANQTPRKTELVFDKVGDAYFLSQIWLSGSDQGVELEKSKAEQKLVDGGMKSERQSIAAIHRSSKKAKKAEARDQR